MKKRIISIVLVLLLVLSLGALNGCGKKKVKKTKEVPNSNVAAKEETMDDEVHKTDPNFDKDTVEVTAPEEANVDTKQGASKPADTQKTVVQQKSIVTIPVMLKENPGTTAAQVEFKYDTSALTFVDYMAGDVYDNHSIGLHTDQGKISVIFMKTDASGNVIDTKETGRLITLKFAVTDNAKPGTYSIGTENVLFTDVAEKCYYPKLSIGAIEIK